MSLHFKTIIPLLGPEITLDDISVDKGFRGAFSYDINRPTLDNHIFLIYSRTTTGFSIERDKRLKSLGSFYSRREIKIKGITFLCYTFVIINPSIRYIKSNLNSMISYKDLLRIAKFWNFTDDDINKYTLRIQMDIFSEQFEQVVIPEWDYIPDWEP